MNKILLSKAKTNNYNMTSLILKATNFNKKVNKKSFKKKKRSKKLRKLKRLVKMKWLNPNLTLLKKQERNKKKRVKKTWKKERKKLALTLMIRT